MSGRGSNRRSQPGGLGDSVGLWILIVCVVLGLSVVYAAVHLGHRLVGLPEPPRDPWEIVFGVLDGTVAWPRESTYVAAAAGLTMALLGGVGMLLWSRRRARGARLDWTSQYLGSGREVEGISHKEARRKASRWGVAEDAVAGICVGQSLAGGRERLFASYEDVMVVVAGPRTGKTLCYAIPAVLDAPGAMLVTSNKRDIVDATRAVRAVSHGEVWVFDPQSIAREEPTSWWWKPLSYVTDEVQAANLADHFASGARAADAKTDAFFEPAGRDLLAGCCSRPPSRSARLPRSTGGWPALATTRPSRSSSATTTR